MAVAMVVVMVTVTKEGGWDVGAGGGGVKPCDNRHLPWSLQVSSIFISI